MRWVSSSAQVRELDRRTIAGVGVPGVALMELAAAAVAESIRGHHAAEARAGVVVVCGAGNNGGDGFAIARRLHAWGFPIRTWALKDSAGDALVMRQTCAALQIPEVDQIGDCGLIVDAIFGTGLARPVQGALAAAIEAIEAHPAPVLAVDLPSGIDADTGQILGVAVHAVRTVTFARLKPGLLQGPGRIAAGVVEVADIGLDAGLAPGDPLAVAEVPEPADLRPLWPIRSQSDHKGSSGHLLVIAGSAAMAGAAVLTCRAALRAGAGLVTLLTASGALPRLAGLPPEVMVIPEGSGERLVDPPRAALDRFDAIAAGPGLGGGLPLEPALAQWLTDLWEREPRAVLFDADALVCARGPGVGPRVITPHPGEAARILGIGVAEVQADRLRAAAQLAALGVAVLKGPGSIVSGPGLPSINPTGGPVLATGGSGDVLSGLLGALLARGLSARDAARLGVWLHGRAGDLLADRRAQGWTAGDVAESIPAAIAALDAGGA